MKGEVKRKMPSREIHCRDKWKKTPRRKMSADHEREGKNSGRTLKEEMISHTKGEKPSPWFARASGNG